MIICYVSICIISNDTHKCEFFGRTTYEQFFYITMSIRCYNLCPYKCIICIFLN